MKNVLEASATLKLGSFGLKLGLEAYFVFIFAQLLALNWLSACSVEKLIDKSDNSDVVG